MEEIVGMFKHGEYINEYKLRENEFELYLKQLNLSKTSVID